MRCVARVVYMSLGTKGLGRPKHGCHSTASNPFRRIDEIGPDLSRWDDEEPTAWRSGLMV